MTVWMLTRAGIAMDTDKTVGESQQLLLQLEALVYLGQAKLEPEPAILPERRRTRMTMHLS